MRRKEVPENDSIKKGNPQREKVILIAEDNPQNLKLVRDLLHPSGYKTLEAIDGKQAVELAKGNKPNLISMGIRMPVINGFEAMGISKNDDQTKNIPIVALTAFAMRRDEERTLAARCQNVYYVRRKNMNKEQPKKAVLAVDDDPMSLKLLAVTLNKEGYRVITAESGEDALEQIELEKPGLVLLDIMMPGINGIETLERIKAFDPDIPVAMVTAVWDEDEAKRAFKAGAYEYITKPVDIEYLKLAVLVKLFSEK
jgi:CheY-like chemotaxis protein